MPWPGFLAGPAGRGYRRRGRRRHQQPPAWLCISCEVL